VQIKERKERKEKKEGGKGTKFFKNMITELVLVKGMFFVGRIYAWCRRMRGVSA
jgi:hypothetical protein